ncbi:sensor histidine kinase [Catenovulum maritimum]|uniref:histidine kinase n=1 Tax=Catenovulum maritimum TaxID=1513271 RepID=A0A0J8GUU8_9ALTE|nr:ATP-binding protein [Catenovulum maritimum]KMT66502.1 hypothetical protein XM47_02905 [Catenovulum maritimum]
MTTEDLQKRIALLERKLVREKTARAEAENLLEDKARSLFQLNKELTEAYDTLKKQEVQIIQQEKMASIGQLSAGVAHEINTPTGFVISNLETLNEYVQQLLDYLNEFNQIPEIKQTIEQNAQLSQTVEALQQKFELNYLFEDLPELIKDSRMGLNRIKTIVTDLREFSHADGKSKEQVDINHVLKQTVHLVKNEIKHHAELDYQFQSTQNILGFPGKLSQVFLNLLLNASHAIDKQGKITIKSYDDNHLVIIEIQDNGKGIPPEIMTKIFDPFFSTKAVGKGTGLGLAISQEIIKQHEGEILVESQMNKGTLFKIKLPSC